MDSNLIAELPKILEAVKEESKSVKEIVASQQFLSNQFDKMVQMMGSLSDEIKRLRAENGLLKLSLSRLADNAKSISNVVEQAEKDIDSHHRAQLSINAMVLGIPRTPQEDTKSIVLEICDILGYKDGEKNIVSCCRVANSKAVCPPIRISFKHVRAKESLLDHKSSFGKLDVATLQGVLGPKGTTGKVVIRDDLSPLSMRIFQELKQLQNSLELRYIWPGRHGAIMVRRTDRSKAIPIQSRQDIQKLALSCRKH